MPGAQREKASHTQLSKPAFFYTKLRWSPYRGENWRGDFGRWHIQLIFKQCRARVLYFHKNPSVTRVSPLHTGFPTSELTLSNTGLSCMGQWNCRQWGGRGMVCTWTCAVQTGVVPESAVLPELQVSMLAHMFNILAPFLLLTFRACVNSHLNCHYLYSQDILLTIFLYTSLQLEVYSRSHNGYFIWKPYDRNLHWHSISGCVGNSENLRFYFQIHPQLNQMLPFS